MTFQLDIPLMTMQALNPSSSMQKELGWKIGLSCTGVQQAETIRAALQRRMDNGERLFDSVQATWNLLEQSAGMALLEAHEEGMHVIVKEGMANGRLLAQADGERPLGGSVAGHSAVAATALAAAAKRLGATPDAVALAAIIAQPFNPMVLSGAATVEHLR